MKTITPHLWFDTQAKEAAEFYVSVFPDSKVTNVTVLHETPSGDAHAVSFVLNGQPFMAISARPVFRFTEAVSFVIPCETQDEIDYYWGKLSAVKEAEQCGWLKDKFGLSWQVTPVILEKLLTSGDAEKSSRVTKAFLQMKKMDIAALQRAYDGA
jgi:predicted 3-demethylubiquinone-9 3-methyltransferase (glyoxalase superfamily)